MVSVIYSDEFLDHETGSFHPEKPGRLTAIVGALKAVPWADQLMWRSPTPATTRGMELQSMLEAAHSRRYIDAVRALAAGGGGRLDPDTPVSPRSYEVAVLAVSAWLDGVDEVLHSGEPAFVLARPPGHHAMPGQGMGFCIFSNAAIAALYALRQPGIARVAILDWDVHHGNGTQAIVERNPNIAYCSLHEAPHYPGTGAASETGDHQNVLNIPMEAGSSLADYQPAFAQEVLPFLQKFAPDLLIVSAGYDAASDDPLANISLNPTDYGLFTQSCLKLTRHIVFGLEGGYHFKALAQSVAATLEACLTPVP